MTIKDLVGFQLVSINDDEIVVRKDNREYRLTFHRDEGDCCGFTELETKLLISNEETSRNPVITDVYVHERDYTDYGAATRITFFGEYLPMANVHSYASSRSGWMYGASVSITCKSLDLDETLVSW